MDETISRNCKRITTYAVTGIRFHNPYTDTYIYEDNGYQHNQTIVVRSGEAERFHFPNIQKGGWKVFLHLLLFCQAKRRLQEEKTNTSHLKHTVNWKIMIYFAISFLYKERGTADAENKTDLLTWTSERFCIHSDATKFKITLCHNSKS